MTEHTLKIKREYALAKMRGIKPFEIRNETDRNFRVGDFIRYKVIDKPKEPTSLDDFEKAIFSIEYITDFEQKPGWVVFTDKMCPVWRVDDDE